MLLNRILLSLAALFLSTLASANSTDITAAYLHPSSNNTATYTGYLSTIAGKTSPTSLAAYTGHTTASAIGNTPLGATLSGTLINGGGITPPEAGGFIFPRQKYGPVCCEARSWVGSGRGPGSSGSGSSGPGWSGSGSSKPGLSTPEPSSLMLLSTGLMGIAGMLKRKLLRA